MNFRTALQVVRCMVRDTLRQSLASRGFWLLLGLSGVCVLLCLSVGVEGAPDDRPTADAEPSGPGSGAISLGFGAVRVERGRDAEASVLALETLIAVPAGGAVGMLLLLAWAGGFLPEFLEPRAAAVLLTKPVPRGALVVGKYAGVLAVVAFQAAVLVGGTWAALGVRTGVWRPGYLACAPLLVLEFAVPYSFAALLAVWTRNTVVSVVGALALWAACAAVNVHRPAAGDGGAPPIAGALLEAAYWVLPKPVDLQTLAHEALGAPRDFYAFPELEEAERRRAGLPAALTSLLFGAAVLAAAARRASRTEY